MEVNNVSLATVAVKYEQYPIDNKPEIAFIGKSNVGKSSLINAMINRKALARTSQNPGKTRTINFYDVENTVYFVDLPGYGYAKISRAESDKWGRMIEHYLLKRPQLKYILMLVDIRHEPSTNDKLMYNWLNHYKYNIVVVATKLDKIKRSQIQKHISIIRKAFEMENEEVILPFSSETKEGKEGLWDIIDEAIANNTNGNGIPEDEQKIDN